MITITSAKQWIRTLERQLEHYGAIRQDRRLVNARMPSEGKTPEQKKTYTEILMRDSLLWAFEELIANRPIYAFRGLVQAGGYAGFCGHDCVTSDAFTTLKNAIEDTIRGPALDTEE